MTVVAEPSTERWNATVERARDAAGAFRAITDQSHVDRIVRAMVIAGLDAAVRESEAMDCPPGAPLAAMAALIAAAARELDTAIATLAPPVGDDRRRRAGGQGGAQDRTGLPWGDGRSAARRRSPRG